MSEQDIPEQEKRYITLTELCKEDPTRDHRERYLGQYDAWISYRRRVPLHMLLKAQTRYRIGQRKPDMEGYIVFLLRYLLLNPRVDNTDAKALLHADGQVMMEIIGEAVGEVQGDIVQEEEEAGE